GVHFRSAQLSPEEIGHRALAGALSDLAAMGAEPGEAYLLLDLPDGTGVDRAAQIARGAKALASRHGVAIAGGDVTRAPSLIVSFTVVGWTDDPGTLVGRDGVADIAAALGIEPTEFAATTGEDYELCACMQAHAQSAMQELGLTQVGRVVEGAGEAIFTDASGELSGYEHSF